MLFTVEYRRRWTTFTRIVGSYGWKMVKKMATRAAATTKRKTVATR